MAVTLRDSLLEVATVLSEISGIEEVKLDTTPEETKIEAMDGNKDVIVQGTLNTPVEELMGVVGLNRLGLLKGLLKHANFAADDALLEVSTRDVDGVTMLSELKFKDSENQEASFRFMNAEVLPRQVTFKGKWEIQVSPSQSKLKELIDMGNLLAKGEEQYYQVKGHKGELRFYMGDQDSNTNFAFVTIDKSLKKEITDKIPAGLYWPISNVNDIIKLGMTKTDFLISLSLLGALQISFSTENGSYKVIMPARKK